MEMRGRKTFEFPLTEVPANEPWRHGDGRESQITASKLFGGGHAGMGDNIFLIAHDMAIDVPEHRHDYIELSFALKGGVINRIGDEDLYMVENSLCIMNEASSHALVAADRDAVVVNVCLRRELFAEGVFRRFAEADNVVARLLRGDAPRDYLFMTDYGGEAIGHTMRSLMEEYRMAGLREDFTVDARTLMLLARASDIETYSFLGIDERMMQVLDMVNVASERASCASIARELGLSEPYLSQYVKQHMGVGLSTIIRNARLERALSLLRTTDLPVDGIAHRVGYASYSHFHRVFAERYGVTPAQSRAFSKGTM